VRGIAISLSLLQSVQCTLIGAYNIRQFVMNNSCWPIMCKYLRCVLPGWLMEQPSLFQTAGN